MACSRARSWKGVIDFSQAVDGKIVTSFAISAGTGTGLRVDPNFAQTGLPIPNPSAAASPRLESMNEPNIAHDGGGAPKDYSAADFGRDIGGFHAFSKESICLICCSSVPVAREKPAGHGTRIQS